MWFGYGYKFEGNVGLYFRPIGLDLGVGYASTGICDVVMDPFTFSHFEKCVCWRPSFGEGRFWAGAENFHQPSKYFVSDACGREEEGWVADGL